MGESLILMMAYLPDISHYGLIIVTLVNIAVFSLHYTLAILLSIFWCYITITLTYSLYYRSHDNFETFHIVVQYLGNFLSSVISCINFFFNIGTELKKFSHIDELWHGHMCFYII